MKPTFVEPTESLEQQSEEAREPSHTNYFWSLDFENHPQEACETMVMLNIVLPDLPADALSGEAFISITDIPEIINRYEYSYHPHKSER